MKKTIKTILFSVVSIIALLYFIKFYIAIVHIDPEYPTKNSSTNPIKNTELSSLSVPIKVNIGSLEKIFLSLVPKSVHQEFAVPPPKNIDKAYVKPNIIFYNIRLSSENGFLVIHANLSGNIKAGVKVAPPKVFGTKIGGGFWIKSGADIDRNSTMVVKIKPSIDPNWKVSSTVIASVDIKNAWLHNIPFRVDTEIEREINKYLRDSLSKDVNDYLAGLDVKKEVESLWVQANNVQEIKVEKHSIWIKTSPSLIAFKPINVAREYLETGLAIEVRTEVSINPIEKSEPMALPNLVLKDSLKGEYKINLPVRASVAGINLLLEKEIKKIELSDKNIKVKINDINIDIVGNRLITKVDIHSTKGLFSKDIKGVIYLESDIEYDTTSHVLRAKNMNYTTETNLFIEKFASWLAKPLILDKLQEIIVFDLSDDIENLKITAMEYMKNLELPNGVQAKISINQLNIDKIQLFDGIYVVLSANGKLATQINDIDIKSLHQ